MCKDCTLRGGDRSLPHNFFCSVSPEDLQPFATSVLEKSRQGGNGKTECDEERATTTTIRATATTTYNGEGGQEANGTTSCDKPTKTKEASDNKKRKAREMRDEREGVAINPGPTSDETQGEKDEPKMEGAKRKVKSGR